jgi:hypothetical protein
VVVLHGETCRLDQNSGLGGTVTGGLGSITVQPGATLEAGADVVTDGNGFAGTVTSSGIVVLDTIGGLGTAKLILNNGILRNDVLGKPVTLNNTLTIGGVVTFEGGAGLTLPQSKIHVPAGASVIVHGPLNDGAQIAGAMEIASDGSLTIDDPYTIEPGGSLTIDAGGTLNVVAEGSITVDAGASLIINGVCDVASSGFILGPGTVNVAAGGTLTVTPTITINESSGPFTGAPFVATGSAIGIDGANLGTPTFTYYAGTTASGEPLPGPPSAIGTYTVVASFSSDDPTYTDATSALTFGITLPESGLASHFR